MICINVMTNQMRVNLNHRRWRERYPEVNKQRGKAWQDANPTKRRNAQRKRRALNPEQNNKYARDWNAKHREEARAKCRKFYAANATEQCARAAAWAKANPEAVRLIGHRRRARITGAGGSFTAEQFKALGDRCLCCGRTEAELAQLGLMLVPDHVLPIARGGSNDISNIQPLCHAYRKGTRSGCNNRKHAKHIDYRGKQCTL